MTTKFIILMMLRTIFLSSVGHIEPIWAMCRITEYYTKEPKPYKVLEVV